jgi:hypothetical protein
MNNELQNYLELPKRYNNIDGTGEMAMGLMGLGFTFLNYLSSVLPKDSMWRHGFPSMVLFAGGLLLMFGVLHWGPKVIKQHITWPRTGYVAYRVGGKSWWTMMTVAVVLGAVPACLICFDRRHDWRSLTWMGNVVIFAVGYGYWICRFSREHSWKWFVLLFMALGLFAIALIAPADFKGLWRPMLAFVCLTWLGSGAATLYLYIRHTQPPAQKAE